MDHAHEDDLPMAEVGPWVRTKHLLLQRYVDISRAVRRKFSGAGRAGATYIDLYCGPGQCIERDSGERLPGSPQVAVLAALKGGVPFTAIHIADANADYVSACARRLESTCNPNVRIHKYVGAAHASAKEVLASIDPNGLHLILLDPFNLGDLPFEIFRTFSRLTHPDILVHVSAMDLQRNLEQAIDADEAHYFDKFAPGWRQVLSTVGPPREVRERIRQYWVDSICRLGYKCHAEHFAFIKGTRNQPLYWLALVSKHNRAAEFWEKIKDVGPTRPLPF